MKHFDHIYNDGASLNNSVVDVSDERAIDAFTIGLWRADLVEEMGRIKPKTVA
jgi:hypothetical protein